MLAADVGNWLRPDAPTSEDRLFRHVYGRGDRGTDQFVPARPYSLTRSPRLIPPVDDQLDQLDPRRGGEPGQPRHGSSEQVVENLSTQRSVNALIRHSPHAITSAAHSVALNS
ncbi:hypothetical protein ACK1X7_01115 [Streptomyces sp. CY1]|uniref:hypothetical protein n=1 Tax=Streptomyces sp. CY1 TaxID=3388313 RepID=UPI00399F2008